MRRWLDQVGKTLQRPFEGNLGRFLGHGIEQDAQGKLRSRQGKRDIGAAQHAEGLEGQGQRDEVGFSCQAVASLQSGTCVQSVAANTQVAVAATPASGSTFCRTT